MGMKAKQPTKWAAKPRYPARSYVDLIDVPEGKIGEYEVEHEIVAANSPLTDGSSRASLIGGQKQGWFSYRKPTRWHRLTYSGGTWMTDQPIEQAQMRDAAKYLRGHVLVGGLGLGVLPTILAKQRDVTRITVIEKSAEVIALVDPHLRYDPAKMNIIRADLMDFVKTPTRGEAYDSAFYDIWQGDGLTTLFEIVLPLLKRSYQNPAIQCRPICWNEDVMRGQLMIDLIGKLGVRQLANHPWRETMPPIASWGTPRGDERWDWGVPFWEWFEARGKDLQAVDVERAARDYIMVFGDPYTYHRWLREWNR